MAISIIQHTTDSNNDPVTLTAVKPAYTNHLTDGIIIIDIVADVHDPNSPDYREIPVGNNSLWIEVRMGNPNTNFIELPGPPSNLPTPAQATFNNWANAHLIVLKNEVCYTVYPNQTEPLKKTQNRRAATYSGYKMSSTTDRIWVEINRAQNVVHIYYA